MKEIAVTDTSRPRRPRSPRETLARKRRKDLAALLLFSLEERERGRERGKVAKAVGRRTGHD